MKQSSKIAMSICTLIAVIAITAATTYYLTTQVFSPIGPGGSGDTNPVNIAADTKVFWNGKDITETWTHNIKYDGISFETMYGSNDLPPELYSPTADFACARLSAGAIPDVDTSNAVAMLWICDGEPYIYAQNGKTVKSVSFSGLADDALIALTLDGVILHLPPDFQFELTFEVKDSRGVTNTTVWGT